MGAVAFCEYGVDELFGSGLAVGAGDAYEGDGELVAVVTCQLLECGEYVGHHHAAGVVAILFVGGDTKGGTLLYGSWHKGVAVKCLPLEGEEKTAGSNLP